MRMLQTELAVKKRRVKVGETRADRAFDIMNYVLLTICLLLKRRWTDTGGSWSISLSSPDIATP